jgi:hypothetical protein
MANFKKDNAGASLAWGKIMIVDKEWIKGSKAESF